MNGRVDGRMLKVPSLGIALLVSCRLKKKKKLVILHVNCLLSSHFNEMSSIIFSEKYQKKPKQYLKSFEGA